MSRWECHAGAAAVVLLCSVSAHAAFIGVLPATPGGTDYQAYYDDQLDITWLANANTATLRNYASASSWAAGLSVGGVTGWRLPSMDVDGSGTPVACDGIGVTQAQCKDNELGHMYFYGAGTVFGSGINESNTGPFTNLGPFAGTVLPTGAYWSGTLSGGGPNHYFQRFSTASGGSFSTASPTQNLYAWAVFDGNAAAVPVPAAAWLLGGALGALGWVRRRQAAG